MAQQLTRYASVLRTAMDEYGLNQEVLAEKSGCSQASISRFLLGDGLPRRDMVDQIGEQFPPHIHRSMVAAWLADQVPSSMASIISINVVNEGSEETDFYRADRAPENSRLKRNILRLERLAVADVNLANILDNLVVMAELNEQNGRPGTADKTPPRLQEDPAYLKAKKELEAAEARVKKRKKSPPKF